MDGGGIDQIVHPQVVVHLPLSRSVEVLPPLLNLVPSWIRTRVPMSHGRKGRPHAHSGDGLGRVIAEGRVGDSWSSGRRHLAVRSKRI